jgi:transmembrane sensor
LKTPESISYIITNFLSGECTSDEADFLIKWLEESHKNRLHYFNLKRIWIEGHDSIGDQEQLEKSWKRLEESISNIEAAGLHTAKPIKFNWKKLGIAATITLLLSVTLFFVTRQYKPNDLSVSVNEINVPFGSRTNIILPDGTTVWLNSGSKLTYNSDYGKENRKVSLQGEAFFNVKHNEGSNFIVKTSDIEIQDLGTEFVVKAYPDESLIETILINGKVEISKTDNVLDKRHYTLKPKQKLTYNKISLDNNNEKIFVTQVDDPQDYAAWKDEKLIITSETLEALSLKLERFYNVKIIFQDNSVKSFKFSGTLDGLTVEEVFMAISKTAPIEYKITKNYIYLKMKRKPTN